MDHELTTDVQGQVTKVWYTPFPKDSMNVAPVTFLNEDRDVQTRQASLLGNPTEPWPHDVPLPVFSMEYSDPLGVSAYNLPDMFHTKQAIVVSERVHDVLSGFDMGENELLEVPLLEQNGQVPLPGRWFALRIITRKEGIDLDASDTGTKEWMKPPSGENALLLNTTRRGTQHWSLNAPHGSRAPEGIAVRAEAAEGVDLWIDPLLRGAALQAFFVSDALHDAIVAARLRVKSLHFAPATVTRKGA